MANALTTPWIQYDDGEAPWSEDEQFEEQRRACRARRKRYGQSHCPDRDGSCTECDHDSQVVLRRKYPPAARAETT